MTDKNKTGPNVQDSDQQIPVKMIKVLAINYRVEEVHRIICDGYHLGEVDHIRQVIMIDSSLSDEMKQQVLLHEIIHCVFQLLGMHDEHNDERLVQSLAGVLHQVLKDNPLLFLT